MNMKLDKFNFSKNGKRPTQENIQERYKKDKPKLKNLQKKIYKLQAAIQAEAKHSILIIFQAMDAAGKDSTIRNVFQKCDVAGIRNVSFKQPTKEESAHDFLWRCHKKTPKKGQITIFNRSHYEEVLVVKVHPEWLASQKIKAPVEDDFWDDRYNSIINFEKHLACSGTTVIKFMLDVTQKEQHNRLKRRYVTPDKQWKFSTGDIKESQLWEKYQSAFDDLLSSTSTNTAPWYVIPADDKELMRLLVSEIIIKKLEELKPTYPSIPDFSEKDLSLIELLVSGKI